MLSVKSFLNGKHPSNIISNTGPFFDIIISYSVNKLERHMVFMGNIRRYIGNIRLRMKLRDSDFPPQVWIENTNACNARCVICPREKMTRPVGFMSMDLYRRLIAEIGRHDNVRRVHLMFYGEPLLDKLLPEKVRLAKEAGVPTVYIVTNGSLLTPEMSKELIQAGLDEMKISFYGTDSVSYKNTMLGLDFDSTINNIKSFFEIRDRLTSRKPKTIIQYIPMESNKYNTEEFKKLFNGYLKKESGDSLNLFPLHNFGGGRKYKAWNKVPLRICGYPWRTMQILNNGDVILCCYDFNGVQVVGSVKDRSIEEVWTSKEMKKLRMDFKKLTYKNYPVCMKCDAIW